MKKLLVLFVVLFAANSTAVLASLVDTNVHELEGKTVRAWVVDNFLYNLKCGQPTNLDDPYIISSDGGCKPVANQVFCKVYVTRARDSSGQETSEQVKYGYSFPVSEVSIPTLNNEVAFKFDSAFDRSDKDPHPAVLNSATCTAYVGTPVSFQQAKDVLRPIIMFVIQ